MKELTDKDRQWLEAFAKNHGFFKSFLLFYKIKSCLSNNQYYWLNLYINKAEDDGDSLLNAEEVEFLKEFSEKNQKLREFLEIHEKMGYLQKKNHDEFLDLKKSMVGGEKERSFDSSITAKPTHDNFSHTVIKIPCPHCNFLCSPQIEYCSKCGEPLPRLNMRRNNGGVSDITDTDYIERNIIHSFEKAINKSIPLKEKFDPNSTCYIKEDEQITGLSLFKCGLDTFPSKILNLKFLKHLALRRNRIQNLPKSIGFFSNLEYLDMRINKLETLPNSIGLLLKLKHLNLSSNHLMMIPDSIGELLLLKTLNLSNNRVKDIPESMGNLISLELLNLKANFWLTLPESIKRLEKNGLQLLVT